ncbi:Additional substrate-specific component CbiN of cobalt ECF transporter [Clostridiaceae bacterium JG1575]|nr:Additional substrate-specific component CbiN of cobalt ECF transporter [Clostridiaceae bacterium JG1575]
MNNKKHTFTENLILLLLVVAIAVVPLFLHRDSEFEGADGKAEETITEVNENYKPWAKPLIEPPGGETESLLFALQASLGAAVIFYILGYLKGKNQKKETEPQTVKS